MSKFGWSYPPGCSGTPYDHEPPTSPLVESILASLEEAGVPAEVNDQVVRLIERWEASQVPTEPEPEPDFETY
jgi:hypothetical protein